MQNVFKIDEFYSHTDLEKLINQPPQTDNEVKMVVSRFEQMQDCVTPEGHDLLESLLLKRHVALILLGHLRLAADSHAKTTTRRMIDKRLLFKSLARGFRDSSCNFAKAIYRIEG
jgi:hypothetical protein